MKMTGKKGRKCSIRTCTSFQHTHKHLSFFRYPKDPDRCKLWIERSDRPDLAEKLNVHEDRVCELHFDEPMFLNDYRNRLHQTAVPTRYLDAPPPPPQKATPRPVPKLKPMNSNSIYLTMEDFEPQFKRQKIDHSDELLEEMEPPGRRRGRYSQEHYLDTLPPPLPHLPPPQHHQHHQQQQQKQQHPMQMNTGIKMKPSPNNVPLSTQIQAQIRSQLQNQEKSIQLTPILTSKNQSISIKPVQTTQTSSSSSTSSSSGMKSSPITIKSPQQLQMKSSPVIQNIQMKQTPQQTPSPPTPSGNYKRPRQIFSIEQEEELADFVRDTSNYYNGMSSKDVRTLAFVYGICNQVDLPVGWRETHQASFDWCLGFIKRNKLTPMMITSHCRSSSNNVSLPTVTLPTPNKTETGRSETVLSEAC